MNTPAESFLEYRNLLFSIACNMLGQVETAQDIVQDAFLSWTQTDTLAVRHPKAFLVKIVTNKCIDYLHSNRVTREKCIGVWLPEPLHETATENAGDRIETYHALSIGLMVPRSSLGYHRRQWVAFYPLQRRWRTLRVGLDRIGRPADQQYLYPDQSRQAPALSAIAHHRLHDYGGRRPR